MRSTAGPQDNRRIKTGPAALGLLLLLTACKPAGPTPAPEPNWLAVDDFLYQLQRARPNRINETAAREMVDFVVALAEYARERQPGFGVFPQNEEQLGLRFPRYLETVTGIGVEDLYYGYPRDHEPSPADWRAERETTLDRWVAAGKLVLTVDYTAKPEQIADAYKRARTRGYVPYVTDRSLGRLRINPGFEPD